MEQHNFKFIAPNRYPSECLITIYRQSGIIIATDIDKGNSVTNSCEVIATEVVRRFNLNPHKMIFIEQYRPGCIDQTTDLVKFRYDAKYGFSSPNWSHINANDFREMIELANKLEYQ